MPRYERDGCGYDAHGIPRTHPVRARTSRYRHSEPKRAANLTLIGSRDARGIRPEPGSGDRDLSKQRSRPVEGRNRNRTGARSIAAFDREKNGIEPDRAPRTRSARGSRGAFRVRPHPARSTIVLRGKRKKDAPPLRPPSPLRRSDIAHRSPTPLVSAGRATSHHLRKVAKMKKLTKEKRLRTSSGLHSCGKMGM